MSRRAHPLLPHPHQILGPDPDAQPRLFVVSTGRPPGDTPRAMSDSTPPTPPPRDARGRKEKVFVRTSPEALVGQLGEEIALARQAAGWSRQQVATEMGTSRNTVINTEEGNTDPSPAMLDRMARLVGRRWVARLVGPDQVEAAHAAIEAVAAGATLEELEELAARARSRKG